MIGSIVEPSGRVVALEANGHNVSVARENLRLNDARNVAMVHSAAARSDGALNFDESLNGQVADEGGARGVVEISSRSIASLVREFGIPDVVYLDVEGFECTVLEGAGHALNEINHWFVEVHGGCGLEKFGGSVDKLLDFFPESTFERYHSWADHKGFTPLQHLDNLAGRRWYFIATRRSEDVGGVGDRAAGAT